MSRLLCCARLAAGLVALLAVSLWTLRDGSSRGADGTSAAAKGKRPTSIAAAGEDKSESLNTKVIAPRLVAKRTVRS